MILRRLSEGDADLAQVLDLIRSEFFYMEGVIDPPSSAGRLTLGDLEQGQGEVWVLGDPLFACMVLTPKTDALCLGKLAVHGAERRRGFARRLVDHALVRARQLGLSAVDVQVRVELRANQRAFAAMGFAEVARTAHAGFDRPTSVTMRRVVTPER